MPSTSTGRDELLKTLQNKLSIGSFVPLPPAPDIATDLLALTAVPEPCFSDIATAAGRDPVVAGKLIGMANAPFFRGRRELSTLKEALVRLGTKAVRAFAIGVAAGSLVPVPRRWDALRSALWSQCVATSVGARLIADQVQSRHLDLVFLGGLFHDVGHLVTLHLALQDGEEPSNEVISSVLDELRVEAGLAVLAHWQVPAAYRALLKPSSRIVQQSEVLQTAARTIEFASDASRTFGQGMPGADSVNLLDHPFAEQLGASEETIEGFRDELVARVAEMKPFLTH